MGSKDWRAIVAYYKNMKSFNERPLFMQRFVYTILVLLFVMPAGLCGESTASELRPVDPSRLTGNTLSLPEIGGSVTAPSQDWQWHQMPEEKDMSAYLCRGPNRKRFSIQLDPGSLNLREAKIEDFRRYLEAIQHANGGEFYSEEGIHLSLPNHPNVFRITSRLRYQDQEVTWMHYAINANSRVALFGFSAFGKIDTAEHESVLSSFKFKPYVPPNKIRDSIYIICAGILSAVAILLNANASRKIISPIVVALLGIICLFIFRFSQMDRSDPHADYFLGREIGMVIITLPVFLVLFYIERRKKRSADLQHDIIDAETISDSEPSDEASLSDSSKPR